MRKLFLLFFAIFSLPVCGLRVQNLSVESGNVVVSPMDPFVNVTYEMVVSGTLPVVRATYIVPEFEETMTRTYFSVSGTQSITFHWLAYAQETRSFPDQRLHFIVLLDASVDTDGNFSNNRAEVLFNISQADALHVVGMDTVPSRPAPGQRFTIFFFLRNDQNRDSVVDLRLYRGNESIYLRQNVLLPYYSQTLFNVTGITAPTGVGECLDYKLLINTTSETKHFDFGCSACVAGGPSRLESGYTAVDEATQYLAAVGHGFSDTSGLVGRDLMFTNNLTTDSVVFDSSDPKEFLVDLLPGYYAVNISFGDNYLRDYVDVYAEGALMIDDMTTQPSTDEVTDYNVNWSNFSVLVTDGQLNLVFDDDGGANNGWAINMVTAVSRPKESTIRVCSESFLNINYGRIPEYPLGGLLVFFLSVFLLCFPRGF